MRLAVDGRRGNAVRPSIGPPETRPRDGR